MVLRLSAERETIMRFMTTGILLLGAMALPASATAQTTPVPPAITRTVVAATKLPTVTDVPLHFKAVSVTLPADEKSGVRRPTASSTRSQERPRFRSAARPKCSAPERDCSSRRKDGGSEGGQRRAIDFPPLLPRPAADMDRPAETAPATVKELYRTTAPIPDLKPGSYDLNLTRVTFPAPMPSNPPHHRSGAALYFIISGTGANTVDGETAQEDQVP